MSEQEQYSYQCQNLGCSNGYLSDFDGAPPEWFAAKGLSEPRNCRGCRTWVKQQVDSVYRCQTCGFAIRQSAKAKITFHKRVGVYEAPTHCRQCKEGGRQKRDFVRRGQPLQRLTKVQQTLKLNVVSYEQLSSYRTIHYGKHIPGHPHSQVGTPAKSGKPVSMTTLVSGGAQSTDLYAAASVIAERTDSDVYQYSSGSNVIKATVVDGIHVEVTIFKPAGDGRHEFVTSYDEVSIEEAQRNIDVGKWK